MSYRPYSDGLYFYPRSPCGERLTKIPAHLIPSIFLSTLSLRRATAGLKLVKADTCISIHALLAESDIQAQRAVLVPSISIHALLAESDMGLDGRFKL